MAVLKMGIGVAVMMDEPAGDIAAGDIGPEEGTVAGLGTAVVGDTAGRRTAAAAVRSLVGAAARSRRRRRRRSNRCWTF